MEGPTDWVSNLVLTPKADPKELRVNIDMTTVNPAIKRIRHVIPTIDELKYRLNGSQHFTKLDMKQGYMQSELHEDSRHLTTFYTHQGLRRAKRLMFGINAAAEIFHEEISRTLSGINSVTNIYDDILIYAKTQKEHDITLLQTLQRLSDCNLTLNPKKCIYNKSRIQFFGVIFSKEGVTPATDKIQALMDMEQPTSASEIRSFLGMVNFSCHFIKNYSNVTAPLRALIHKNAKFEWTIECQTAFDTTRTALREDSLNAYFDPNRSLRVDLYGPVPGSGGEYLLVVQCLYSHFPAEEIISSTGHKAVMPALDRIMSAFGIPEKLGSDNSPRFNGQEFHAFARYMGFQFDPVTPLVLWANGTAERFMPNLTKVLQTVKEEGHNWRQEL